MSGCTLRANSSNTRCWYSHLGDEARRLEEAFAVVPAGRRCRSHATPRLRPAVRTLGVVDRHDHLIDLMLEAVVLGVEDLVHGGQPDVLVAAAVAGDEVHAETARRRRCRQAGRRSQA